MVCTEFRCPPSSTASQGRLCHVGDWQAGWGVLEDQFREPRCADRKHALQGRAGGLRTEAGGRGRGCDRKTWGTAREGVCPEACQEGGAP